MLNTERTAHDEVGKPSLDARVGSSLNLAHSISPPGSDSAGAGRSGEHCRATRIIARSHHRRASPRRSCDQRRGPGTTSRFIERLVLAPSASARRFAGGELRARAGRLQADPFRRSQQHATLQSRFEVSQRMTRDAHRQARACRERQMAARAQLEHDKHSAQQVRLHPVLADV